MKITLVALFLEGLLSFFSPCVLPILPVYLSILTGEVEPSKEQKNILIHTLCFVAGITGTFFILAFASSIFSQFLQGHRQILQIIGGIIILVMGFLQLELLQIPFLAREFSAKQVVYRAGKTITPMLAFLMGFTFSFSWTPCIGPILASVFIYASNQTGGISLIWILTYCSGFILPFILLAFFSKKLLNLFIQQSNYLLFSKRLSALILLLIGISMIMGWFGQVSHLFQ